MAQKTEKTNVMRILEQKKIPYTPHFYPHGEGIPTDGVTVANFVGKDVKSVYKTLVTRSASKNYYVFVIPVAEHLDLKKAAKAVGEKSIEMIRQDEEIRDVPVVFLTAVADKMHIASVLQLNPAGYLLKPPNTEVLKETISSILNV